jgi:hypothetical protein
MYCSEKGRTQNVAKKVFWAAILEAILATLAAILDVPKYKNAYMSW